MSLKSKAKIRSLKKKEALRLMKLYPHLTCKTIANCLHVCDSYVYKWKREYLKKKDKKKND